VKERLLRLPGVAVAVFPAEPERSFFNNAMLDLGLDAQMRVAVLDAMKAIRFEAMGANRTYWDFYFGFGVAIPVYLLVQAVVLWQLAGIERRMPGSTRLIIAAFCISFVVNAIVVWKYFFAVPLVMAVAIAICLAVAFQLSPRE
jgi:hypothetical protein